MTDGKDSTKNKFELDRPDHDSHANHTDVTSFSDIYLLDEVYAIPIKCKSIIQL